MDQFPSEMNEGLGKILYNNREAIDPFISLQALNTLAKLCEMRANIRIKNIFCKNCDQPISGRDEEIIKQSCMCKTRRQEYFHRKCFLISTMVNSESNFKCNNNQCNQDQQQQIQQCYQMLDYLCKLCNAKITLSDPQKYVKAGCECPTKRVHKQCLVNQFQMCKYKQHQLKCEDCNSFYREAGIIDAVQNYEYGCLKCHEKYSNHIYWDCVPIDCSPYRICRGCFEHYLKNINFENTKLNQIQCNHEQNCNNYFSYHTLNQYFYKTERVQNKDISQDLLQTKNINLEQDFVVAKCPGFVLKQSKYPQAFKFLTQENLSHFILKKVLLYPKELEDYDNEFNGNEWQIERCNNVFEVNQNYRQQRCSNCNYKFCHQCELYHGSISCSTFKKIKDLINLQEENLLQFDQFGNNMQEQILFILELKLSQDLFNFNNNATYLGNNFNNLFLPNNQQYFFDYPQNNFFSIQLNIEFLYGQRLDKYNQWLYMYIPILNIDHLRQCITSGIERNVQSDMAEMVDRYSQKSIKYGTVLYSQYQYALDNSYPIILGQNQQQMQQNNQFQNRVKAILLCKVDPNSIKQPSSYKQLYVSSQMMHNSNGYPYDNYSIIAYQIIVFNQF